MADRRTMRRRYFAILACLLPLVFTAMAVACPFCKDEAPLGSAPGGPGGPIAPSGNGYNASVIFMLGGLFMVIGMVLYTIIKGVRSSTANLPVPPPQRV